jgi:hypothetical protein
MNRLIAAAAIAVTAILFVIPAGAQSVPVIALTNGPPNIPYAAPGSCTTSTCTWIQSGIKGEVVSDVYLDMVPISQNYTGMFSLSGPNAANYTISTSSDGTRNVAHIATAAPLSAGDDDITVNAGNASQRITVHKVSGTQAACGGTSQINSASSLVGNGGIVLLAPNCTYSFSGSIVPAAANQVFIGAGAGSTIVDGTGSAGGDRGFGGGSASGAAIMNMEIRNYNALNGIGVQVDSGWVARNLYVHDTWTGLFMTGCPATALNNRLIHNSANGLQGGGGLASLHPGGCGTPQVVAGNEWAQNNTSGSDSCDDTGQKWINTNYTFTLNIYNNYAHDNLSNGLWTDTQSQVTMNVHDNTFIGNTTSGFWIELSGQSGQINVNNNLFSGNSNTAPTNCSSFSAPLAQIVLGGGSANINMHDNNFVHSAGANGLPAVYWYSGEIGAAQNNVTVHNNTFNFLSTETGNGGGFPADMSWNPSSVTPTESGSYSNSYHLVNGNTSSDRHWSYFNNAPQTFSQWQASSGVNGALNNPDTATSRGAGTIDTDGTKQGTGCTHVACSGSGIGSGGVPILSTAPPSDPSIQGIALSNSTFTPNVANGTVGTVSVTMSDGSAFPGTLSITGTNSGGFHLSGNTMQEKASGGTLAGSYNDFNIVATQAGATNSPQQISPQVTGVMEGPFAGSVRSITNRIQAEDFDVGGSDIAYRAADVCGIGIDTAYGADRLNVHPTTDLDGASNLKVSCNQAGDWHNYTITAATTGTYTLSMRVANVEAGAKYNVAIDGAKVASGISVPNTGGYETFATVTSAPFGLTAGQHVIQIALDAAGPSGFGGDFNWMQGTPVKAGAIGTSADLIATH